MQQESRIFRQESPSYSTEMWQRGSHLPKNSNLVIRLSFPRFAIPFLVVALLPLQATAADLSQVFREAQLADAQYASARSQYNATLEKVPQARAGLRPVVILNANSNWNDMDVSETGTTTPGFSKKYNSNGYQLTLTQPLFRVQNWIQFEQSKLQAAQAEYQLKQAEQDLIVRVAQAYFDVLLATDTLAFTTAQKDAVRLQLGRAKKGFEVGDSSITDVNEAQARFDLAFAQELAAQSDLEVRRRALFLITGRTYHGLAKVKDSVTIKSPEPNAMEAWVELAAKANFQVMTQEINQEIARREVDRNGAGHYPSLDMVISQTKNHAGSTTNTGLPTEATTNAIGLQLSIPIYSGGGISAKQRESAELYEKSRSDLDFARRSAAFAAEQSYLSVTSGLAQVGALRMAVKSALSALESNKMSYEVGTRINIDVLNAQQQVFSTRRDLSRAIFDTLIAILKLKNAAGALDSDDVSRMNELFALTAP